MTSWAKMKEPLGLRMNGNIDVQTKGETEKKKKQKKNGAVRACHHLGIEEKYLTRVYRGLRDFFGLEI